MDALTSFASTSATPALAVDDAGEPHLLGLASAGGRHAFHDAAGWHEESVPVAAIGGAFGWAAAAIATGDRVALAYAPFGTTNVNLVERTGGAWDAPRRLGVFAWDPHLAWARSVEAGREVLAIFPRTSTVQDATLLIRDARGQTQRTWSKVASTSAAFGMAPDGRIWIVDNLDPVRLDPFQTQDPPLLLEEP